MSFDDMFNPEEEISNLKIEIEALKEELKDHKGFQNIILKQREDLSYTLAESSCWVHEFEDFLSEEDYKKCTDAGNKKYQAWIIEQFEIDKAIVKATLLTP